MIGLVVRACALSFRGPIARWAIAAAPPAPAATSCHLSVPAQRTSAPCATPGEEWERSAAPAHEAGRRRPRSHAPSPSTLAQSPAHGAPGPANAGGGGSLRAAHDRRQRGGVRLRGHHGGAVGMVSGGPPAWCRAGDYPIAALTPHHPP